MNKKQKENLRSLCENMGVRNVGYWSWNNTPSVYGILTRGSSKAFVYKHSDSMPIAKVENERVITLAETLWNLSNPTSTILDDQMTVGEQLLSLSQAPFYLEFPTTSGLYIAAAVLTGVSLDEFKRRDIRLLRAGNLHILKELLDFPIHHKEIVDQELLHYIKMTVTSYS